MCEPCNCETVQARQRVAEAMELLSEVAKGKAYRAVVVLHGLRWAASHAQADCDMDGFMCLMESVLLQVGADLETVHSALGGTPLGYFGSCHAQGEAR